ncbi:hypothetical protein [Massilia yuzhufengensis]|uniref:Type I restriction enzyme, S subunit n=1 Tax=Massilia yuzhufengensis TaxID=1164594 RepID=A0A1I1GA46_9BURK|nr:hypothetical protein [Massilia yuzhufengensis]SFC08152.1 type I restriction enzyme, S subunit [Massilia yuzhufengensis]
MTDQAKDSVPRIRFKEFAAAWEPKELGQIYTERNERGNDSLPILSVSIHSGISNGELSTETLGKKVRRSEDKSLYKHVYSGDLVLNMMRAWQGALGVAKIEGMVSPAYLTATPNDTIYPLFMDCGLRRPQVVAQMNRLSYGVTDFRKRLYWESFVRVKFAVPSVPEQHRITSYFSDLSSLIALHRIKYDKLVALKKAMLQRMFPRAGTAIPELRFKGFSGNWVIEHLGQIGRTQSGIGFPEVEQGGKVGIPFFKISDMSLAGNENEMVAANNYVSDEQLRRRRWVPISNLPAVVFAKVGAALMLNRKKMVRAPFLIDNNAMAYIFDSSWDGDFGKTLFDTIYLPKYAQVGALPSYNGPDIEDIAVHRPKDMLEQTRIGDYFKQLNVLISKHATQLQKLKQIESACMKEMFA